MRAVANESFSSVAELTAYGGRPSRNPEHDSRDTAMANNVDMCLIGFIALELNVQTYAVCSCDRVSASCNAVYSHFRVKAGKFCECEGVFT